MHTWGRVSKLRKVHRPCSVQANEPHHTTPHLPLKSYTCNCRHSSTSDPNSTKVRFQDCGKDRKSSPEQRSRSVTCCKKVKTNVFSTQKQYTRVDFLYFGTWYNSI